MIGTSLGPYRVLELLGSGGMGDVYLAEDSRLGRRVAIKVLTPELAGDRGRLARFEQEARATSALNHPGICTLFDIGDHDGQLFLVMEALDGRTLRDTIGNKPLPTDKVLSLGIQIADALGEAHGKGIIHRDLKSANVFITADGRSKILDFGLAKLDAGTPVSELSSMPTSAPAGQLTREGATVGTVAYMSPEQARGQTLDARSDLFSFGVLLYEMSTGKVPFDGATEAVVFDQILNHDPPSAIELNPRLPTGLVRLIGRALQKNPADRFASAYEIKGQLEEIRRAPGSLDSILPAEHISSTAAVKPPPRPEEQLVDPETGAPPASRDEAPIRPSIAVLPFESLSADPEDDFFAAGLAEEIINALAHLDGLDVAARTSAFSFKGRHEDVRQIGEKLGVGSVLEGSVRRAGNRLRVTAQLIKADDGYHMWSERYDRELEDVFAVQDEITEAIVKVLEVHLVRGQSGEIKRRATTDLRAFELCAKGRHFWAMRTPQSMARAIEHFERALELDPGYAIAWAGLADAHAIIGAYQVVDPADAVAAARPAAERAIELDPTLPEPHFSQGFMHLWFSDEWQQALPHFERALELDPRHVSTLVYHGALLSMLGRRKEALEQTMLARRLDPMSSFVHSIAAIAYRNLGMRDEAFETLERAMELDAGAILPKWILAFNAFDDGRVDEARGLAAEVAEQTNRHTTFVGMLGFALAESGDEDGAREILRELQTRAETGFVSPLGGLQVALGLGDMELLARYAEALKVQGGGVLALYATVRPYLAEHRDDPIAGPAIRSLPIWPEADA